MPDGEEGNLDEVGPEEEVEEDEETEERGGYEA